MQIKSVLCVCTGNICRSPLAEGWLRREMPSLNVSSAGIGAVQGGEMPSAAAAIAAREGLDLADHRGRQVTAGILQAHELVLVMEAGQRDWLGANFPESRGRTFVANHWADGTDIQDPYRLSPDVFEQVYGEIVNALTQWQKRLMPSAVTKNYGTR